jgi:anti-sigma factor RsiW
MNPLQWHVVIEEYVAGGNAYLRQLTQSCPATDVEHAMWLAQEAALRYKPKNPRWPKSRALFRTQDGGWLVKVEGAMRTFQFRVTVAEYYGLFPGEPAG